MKRRFVLDENVLILAESGTDERGNEDPSAGRLIVKIAENCHALAFDEHIYRLYMRWGREVPRTFKVVKPMLFNSEKIVYPLESTPLEYEHELPEDDRPFVRVAVAANAVLVTFDSGLLDALRRVQASGRLSLTFGRPIEAIKYT